MPPFYCVAIRSNGKRCRNKASEAGGYCSAHAPQGGALSSLAAKRNVAPRPKAAKGKGR
jgi:hypothetical protein